LVKKFIQKTVILLIIAVAGFLFYKHAIKKGDVEGEKREDQTIIQKLTEFKVLEIVDGLTFDNVEKTKPYAAIYYKYHRKFELADYYQQIKKVLNDYEVNISNLEEPSSDRKERFKLSHKNHHFIELYLEPDLNTFAGQICIIVDDFGYNMNKVTKGFLELDIPLTYSIIPGHSYSKKVGKLATERGFEVIVHFPMESKKRLKGEENFILKRSHTYSEIMSRMSKAFDEIPAAAGMNNHQGSAATESRFLIQAVADFLKGEGKYFVDSRTTPKSVVVEIMENANVRVAERSIFLDYEDKMEIIYEQLNKLKEKARRDELAIGIAHNKELTLHALKTELPKLVEEGFKFVYASGVVE
tara:strand:- start:4137 stop:5204 length:1068 start_codon:yes stop_codon:yes gene_type:complete